MAVKKTTETENVTEAKKPVFTREQLRNSKKFAKYKDIVSVVICADESCTVEECEKRINDFLNKEVG